MGVIEKPEKNKGRDWKRLRRKEKGSHSKTRNMSIFQKITLNLFKALHSPYFFISVDAYVQQLLVFIFIVHMNIVY